MSLLDNMTAREYTALIEEIDMKCKNEPLGTKTFLTVFDIMDKHELFKKLNTNGTDV